MRVGLLTGGDSRDRNLWSGTPFHMARALQERGCEVVHLGPYPQVRQNPSVLLERAFDYVARRVLGRRHLWERSLRISRATGQMAGNRIRQSGVQAVLAPAASVEIAFLDSEIPLVYCSDTTFALFHGYYPEFTRILGASARNADLLERMAIRRADQLLYPTDWAARSAVDRYGADPERVHVAAFGANLDAVPSREEATRTPASPVCRLLFLATRWHPKGGDVAVDALRRLQDLGVAAHLTICGSMPPDGVSGPDVEVIPSLDKNDPLQERRLRELLLASHFLILPTRAECFGIVFAEANAYGVPAVTRATGGVPNVVRDGVNGLLLPIEADGAEYARAIARHWTDPALYRALRRSSREEYESRLNWSAWASVAHELLHSAVESRSGIRR